MTHTAAEIARKPRLHPDNYRLDLHGVRHSDRIVLPRFLRPGNQVFVGCMLKEEDRYMR